MKSWKTTVIGILEATMVQVTAESMFELTWTQRGLVFGMALARASLGFFAKDKDVTGVA